MNCSKNSRSYLNFPGCAPVFSAVLGDCRPSGYRMSSNFSMGRAVNKACAEAFDCWADSLTSSPVDKLSAAGTPLRARPLAPAAGFAGRVAWDNEGEAAGDGAVLFLPSEGGARAEGAGDALADSRTSAEGLAGSPAVPRTLISASLSARADDSCATSASALRASSSSLAFFCSSSSARCFSACAACSLLFSSSLALSSAACASAFS